MLAALVCVIVVAFLLWLLCIPYVKVQLYRRVLPLDTYYMGFRGILRGSYLTEVSNHSRTMHQNVRLVELAAQDSRVILTSLERRPMIVLRDLRLLQQFFQNSSKVVKNLRFKSIISEFMGGGLFVQEGEQHKTNRKLISTVFNAKFLKDKAAQVREIVKEAVRELRQQSEKDWVDVFPVLNKLTSSVMIRCFFGIDQFPERIDGKPLSLYLSELLSSTIMKEVNSLSRIIFNVKGKEWLEQTRIVNQVIARKVRELLDHNLDQNYLIQLIYNHVPGDMEHKFAEVMQQFKTFFFAGSDTTSHLMTFILYNLCKHPEYLPKLRAEANDTSIEDPPLLNGFIRQTARMYGPVTNVIIREALQDFYLDDVLVKKGYYVMADTMAIHLSSRFHEAPFQFRPERWLEKEPSPFSYFPFGGGPRNCIGQYLALMQTKLLLVQLLSTYSMQMQPEFNPYPLRSFISRFRDPFKMKIANLQ